MSSELERRTAIIVTLRCGRTPKEIIDVFKFRHADCGEAWMTQIAAGRPYLYQQDGAPAHTSNLVQNWCLENLDMFCSKEFWPSAALTSTPATTTCGASLRGH
ncbi:Transposable element tcb1 transposase [Caligus rogercresseyi]|uniref:Transposable element tcb1 transposase n=1 Tax=Caligus rogercresseyi TaxID=217165 RepID=A0A7T8K038_CALRO|nr:Transposable element tcb1 transposase [Caligus rogercresseyi]